MLDHWQANLSAKSDGLSLNIPEIAKLTVVPDIHLEQLPESAITVSNDEVILEQKPKLSADQGLNSFNPKNKCIFTLILISV